MASRTVSVNLVANVGQYVSGMNSAAGATMRLGESATTSTKKAQSGFDLAGKSSLVMGAAVVGGLAMAIHKSMDFEKSMSAVGAATQATGATLDSLRAAAMKAGADTKYSATEAADAITEMGKAGVSAKDIMGGGLTGALSLAAAGQIDVAEAAGIASTAMTQFSLSGKDLPHVADLLAAGAGKAMGSVDDLGMALNQTGLVAASSGLSIEETTGTLAAFAAAGLIGSDAGTSMKQMLQKLQAPSKEAAGIMSELGINMYDANGNMLSMSGMAGQLKDHMAGLTQEQRNNALATIFGSDAVRAANVLYSQGSQGISDWTGKVNDAGYAAKQAAALQDNLSGDLEKLGGSFDTLMITLGQGAQGPLRELVQGLGGVVDGITWLVEAWQSLPAPVQTALVALAAVAALKNPVTSAMASIAVKAMDMGSAMVGAMRGMSGLKAAGSGLLGVFGGPWGIAIAGAAVGLSLLVSWLDKSDQATHGATEAQTALADALMQSKGALDANVRSAAAKAAMDAGILDSAKLLHIPLSQVTDAILGQGNALNEVAVEFLKYRDARTWGSDADQKAAAAANASWQALLGLAGQTEGNIVSAQDLAAATATTGEAMAVSAGLTDEAAKAQEEWLKTVSTALQSFVDPLGAYKGLLDEKTAAEQAQAQATADATKSSTDSWKDYVKDVGVSLDELATRLEQQLTDQANWRTNIGKIALWAGTDVANYLEQMGKDGVTIVAQMADGTTAGAQRMAKDINTVIQRGGLDWAASMDNSNKVLAAISASGGKATRSALSAQLNIGVNEIQAIADKYGIALATGINPVLASIGKKVITVHQKAGRRYIGMNEYADGGYTGPGGKYTPAGIAHAGEIVWSQDDIAAHGGVAQVESMRRARRGYANGGFVTAADVPKPYSTAPFRPPLSAGADGVMQKEYADVQAWVTANAAPPAPAGFSGMAGGGVQRWLPVVLQSLGMMGQPASLAQTVLRRMNQESGGNPTIVNRWDSNWQRGTPSVGLMQVIGPTYRAYADSRRNVGPYSYGTSVDPLSNILASEHYAMSRYGSLSAAYNKAGGYAAGGATPVGSPFWVGEKGPELMWSNREQYVTSAAKSREFSGAGRGGGVAIDYDRLARAIGSRSTQITAVAAPNERALAAAIVDRQRDLEFLHG